MTYTPIYRPFDLGAFDVSLKGETLMLLQNPTRGFRQSFLRSEGQAFLDDVAFICNIQPGVLEAAFADYEESLFIWLFVPVQNDDLPLERKDRWILPRVYSVWDAYELERVKKLHAPQTRSDASATAEPGLTPASA